MGSKSPFVLDNVQASKEIKYLLTCRSPGVAVCGEGEGLDFGVRQA